MIHSLNCYEEENSMNQPTIQNMTNDELQIFHSALCLIEETIYEHLNDYKS